MGIFYTMNVFFMQFYLGALPFAANGSISFALFGRMPCITRTCHIACLLAPWCRHHALAA